jgi:hemin uptake protein HemP
MSESQPPMKTPPSVDRNVDSVAAAPDASQQPSMPKIVPFTDLARCGEEIWISHQGQLYRLQSTRAGKLILTK